MRVIVRSGLLTGFLRSSVVRSQHVTVKLPVRYVLALGPQQPFETGEEDGRQVVRFDAPTDVSLFIWSVSYKARPLTLMEEVTDEVDANQRLISIVGSVVTVLAAVAGYLLKTHKRRVTKHYLGVIDDAFNEFYTDKEKCRSELELLRQKIDRMFSKGRIDEAHHHLLARKTEWYLKELDKQ